MSVRLQASSLLGSSFPWTRPSSPTGAVSSLVSPLCRTLRWCLMRPSRSRGSARINAWKRSPSGSASHRVMRPGSSHRAWKAGEITCPLPAYVSPPRDLLMGWRIKGVPSVTGPDPGRPACGLSREVFVRPDLSGLARTARALGGARQSSVVQADPAFQAGIRPPGQVHEHPAA